MPGAGYLEWLTPPSRRSDRAAGRAQYRPATGDECAALWRTERQAAACKNRAVPGGRAPLMYGR